MNELKTWYVGGIRDSATNVLECLGRLHEIAKSGNAISYLSWLAIINDDALQISKAVTEEMRRVGCEYAKDMNESEDGLDD